MPFLGYIFTNWIVLVALILFDNTYEFFFAIANLIVFVGIYLAQSADLSDGAGLVKMGTIGAVIILFGALTYHRFSLRKSLAKS